MHSLDDRVVDDGDQTGEKAVVGGGDNGLVKGLLGFGLVLPCANDLGHGPPQREDPVQLLIGGAAAGHGGQFGLEEDAGLEQIPEA